METKVRVENTSEMIKTTRRNQRKLILDLKDSLNKNIAATSALVSDTSLKFFEMEAEDDKIRISLKKLIDGLKNENEIKINQNESMNLITSSYEETVRLSQSYIFAELGQTLGHTSSFNETGKGFDSQDHGCGGILVAESGIIRYESFPKMLNPISKIRCVWTIRANWKSEVRFQLGADNLEMEANENFLLIKSSLATVEYTRDKNETYPRDSGTASQLNKEIRMEFPVVFVTLLADSHTSVKFDLTFKGVGEDKSVDKLYSHYHFRDARGSVEYPNIRGSTSYSPNEFATFVINPLEPMGNLRIETEKLDIEYHRDCLFDQLYHIEGKSSNTHHYRRQSIPSNFRHCGTCNSTQTCAISKGGWNTDNIISIFTSDSSSEQTGFKFNWVS